MQDWKIRDWKMWHHEKYGTLRHDNLHVKVVGRHWTTSSGVVVSSGVARHRASRHPALSPDVVHSVTVNTAVTLSTKCDIHTQLRSLIAAGCSIAHGLWKSIKTTYSSVLSFAKQTGRYGGESIDTK